MSLSVVISRTFLRARQHVSMTLRASMASNGRNYFLKDGSTETGITPDVRDLILKQCTAENVDQWKRGAGIQDPIVFSMKDPEDIDDDQTPDMVYYPHKGEEIKMEEKPSPVLLVKRVKSLSGEPYWNREILERLNLGFFSPPDRVIAVPNMPTMNYKLFTVKHLIEIIPLRFPMGFPSDEEFDPAACSISSSGEFYYNPKLKVDPGALDPRTPMKISEKDREFESRKSWYRPFSTPLGNMNYHRNTKRRNPAKTNWASDNMQVVKFKDKN